MLNFHIIKVTLKNGEARYRTILTKSGKGIKTKTLFLTFFGIAFLAFILVVTLSLLCHISGLV